MIIHAYTCYIMPQTWEVTNRTCSNLSNLYSIFVGFRMFQMFKLQFLQSWRFQNIQQNILWRIVTPWVLRLKFNDPLVCLLYHWLQCPRAGVIASRFTLHWRMNAIVSKCIEMYQNVSNSAAEVAGALEKQLAGTRSPQDCCCLFHPEETTMMHKRGPPENTSQVVACLGKGPARFSNEPVFSMARWKQERASVSCPYKTSVKPVLLHAACIICDVLEPDWATLAVALTRWKLRGHKGSWHQRLFRGTRSIIIHLHPESRWNMMNLA